MYKTEEELKLESEANKFCYMNRIIDNIKVKQQNGRLWTPYHDMQLYEYVIKHKFNFYEISNAFQKLCTNDKKYEYSEDAVRLHWAFLHAMRNFGQTPDESYYQRMKLQYDKEKPKTFKTTVEEREKMLSEEEDIRRMKEEFEKMMKEKEEKEKKMKEDKEKKEKERIEKEKKEDQEVEELINTTTKRREENDENKDKENEEKKSGDENKENKGGENKEEDNKKINNENKLYDENNEPEFIKQLFSKKIPQEILDKLNKDKEKYNNNSNNNNNNNDLDEINNKNNITQTEPKITETNNTTNTKEETKEEKNKKETNEININLNINQEISKKEEEETNKINNEEEDDFFPIKSKKQKESAEPNKIENINMEKELRNTQDFNDYIENNPELKKQYEQLNNYCNFALKSLNYLVNKGAGVDNLSESEAKKIEQANQKLNEFLLEPIIKKTEEEGLTLEDWNKKIEEEERKMSFETTNYDNYMKNAPKDEERDMKLNKFKEHLFGFAEKISTEELLEKITGIIGQTNAVENNNNNNNNNNQENANNQINENNNVINNNNNNINLENAIQNFMNNIENNNNNEDEKSENTKEQSESANENAVEDSGRNTISSVGSLEFPRKYRHVYRGMVYYSDKPDEKTKNKNNNRNNKKKKDEDDEIEEDDDDDDDDYNK